LTIGFTKIGVGMVQDSCSSNLHLNCINHRIHNDWNRNGTGPKASLLNDGFLLNFDYSNCIDHRNHNGTRLQTSDTSFCTGFSLNFDGIKIGIKLTEKK
jgi:hypothetical protein